MGHQILSDLIARTVNEKVEAELKNGKSEQDITDMLNNIDLEQMYLKLFDTINKDSIAYFESTMYEQVLETQYLTDEFLARQKQKWGKAFIAYEAMYILSIEAVESYGLYLNELEDEESKKSNQFTFLVHRELHARACQIYLEILCLIQTGFADGAFARWRSMYELSVTSCFIRENGEIVAKSFYNAVESEDGWHDWAKPAECFKSTRKKHIRFSDLQEQTHFSSNEIWKQQYGLGNKVVHASPQGTFKRLSIKEPLNVLSIGRSDYGVSVPAEHAAISLGMITTDLISIFPYENGIIAIKNISDWIDVIRKYFIQAEKDCFEG